MTPTWKKGDVYFAFKDSIDCMKVIKYTVTAVGKKFTVIQTDKRYTNKVRNEYFLSQHSPSRIGAVTLEIQKEQNSAETKRKSADRSDALVIAYRMFIQTLVGVNEVPSVRDTASEEELRASQRAIDAMSAPAACVYCGGTGDIGKDKDMHCWVCGGDGKKDEERIADFVRRGVEIPTKREGT